MNKPKLKIAAGAFLVLSPLVAVYASLADKAGVLMAAFVFMSAVCVIGAIFYGVQLFFDGIEELDR